MGTGGGGIDRLEAPLAAAVMAEGVPEVNVEVDDRPWRLHGTGAELSEREADECLHWMGQKVLEHAGFQSECVLEDETRMLILLCRHVEGGFGRVDWCRDRVLLQRRSDDALSVR